MAFIFDPNPSEGDRQTNDETGVEYIFTDGAWRALGRKAEAGGGVPVGSIMIWINNNPPAGWFKLQGDSFDVDAYPLLHAYLDRTHGYTSGTLPNWSGRYPGESGDHLNGNLGSFADYLTARPKTIDFGTDNPGNHTHKYGNSEVYGSGTTKKAHDASNNQSYDTSGAGSHSHKITSGGDSTTRPKTVVVHYIIKHD